MPYCVVRNRERIFLFYECVTEDLRAFFKIVQVHTYGFEAMYLAIRYRCFTVTRVTTSEMQILLPICEFFIQLSRQVVLTISPVTSRKPRDEEYEKLIDKWK